LLRATTPRRSGGREKQTFEVGPSQFKTRRIRRGLKWVNTDNLATISDHIRNRGYQTEPTYTRETKPFVVNPRVLNETHGASESRQLLKIAVILGQSHMMDNYRGTSVGF
jgi:hypothetical protein